MGFPRAFPNNKFGASLIIADAENTIHLDSSKGCGWVAISPSDSDDVGLYEKHSEDCSDVNFVMAWWGNTTP